MHSCKKVGIFLYKDTFVCGAWHSIPSSSEFVKIRQTQDENKVRPARSGSGEVEKVGDVNYFLFMTLSPSYWTSSFPVISTYLFCTSLNFSSFQEQWKDRELCRVFCTKYSGSFLKKIFGFNGKVKSRSLFLVKSIDTGMSYILHGERKCSNEIGGSHGMRKAPNEMVKFLAFLFSTHWHGVGVNGSHPWADFLHFFHFHQLSPFLPDFSECRNEKISTQFSPPLNFFWRQCNLKCDFEHLWIILQIKCFLEWEETRKGLK